MPEERFLHYRILGPLGQGGMGEVFLAEDERLGRRVALKFLPQASSADPDARERLRREARSLAALSHPHIAAIHALESDGYRSCLVMEYVEGETLAARIAKRPLRIPEVIAIGRAIAEALAHAHARSVIHRDVKPANIIVDSKGAATLTDFGIAHIEGATRLTAEGFTPGTVSYMSPEQTRGETVDARSDLFSLGAVLYEALTGRRAFAGDRPEATLYAIQHHEPEPPSALRSGIPLELERIVLKSMKKDPAHRYQHAEDLAADLSAMEGVGAKSADARTVTSGASTPGGPSTGGSSAGASSPGGRGRAPLLPRLALGIGLVAIAAAIYLFGPFRPGGRQAVNTAEAAQKSIAVLSFQNLEEPADPRGSAPIATSLLTVGLGESQVMPVLSAQRIHDVLRQMGKPNEIVKGAEALQVAGRAGAAYVVTGYIYATQPSVILAAEVASTSDGTVLTACKVQTPGGERGLFMAVDSLTTALRDGLARAGFGVRESSVDVAGLTTRNPAAYRAYVRGLDQLYQSNWTEADHAFRSAIAGDSTFALAWYYSAVATWWNADIEGAQAEVEAALRLGNRLSGRDREGLKALGTLIRNDYPGAARQYRALLDRYRDDKEFLYGLGEALYHGGTDEAGGLRALERATEIDPSFGVAYGHIVDIDIDRNDLDAALAAAERLVRADPDNAHGHKLKSDVLFLRGDAEGAIRASRDALARNPESIDVLMGIACAQGILGNFDSLRVAIGQLSNSQRPEAKTLAGAAQVFFHLVQGRFHEGEALAAGVERERGSHYGSQRYLFVVRFHAMALFELGRTDEAIRENWTAAKVVRKFNPNRGAGLAPIAEALARAGRVRELESLLQDYNRVLRREGVQHERKMQSYISGHLALAKGRPKEAVTFFETGTLFGPNLIRDWRRRWSLARALLAAGDKDRAIPELEEVVKRAPGGGDPIDTFKAINILARLYEERGRRDDALALYGRVVRQYRSAEPGVKANEEALAGIQRLSKSPS